jgi:hypothetical protein
MKNLNKVMYLLLSQLVLCAFGFLLSSALKPIIAGTPRPTPTNIPSPISTPVLKDEQEVYRFYLPIVQKGD